ncbi:MAG: pyrrolo-quinoline quinone [Planctomycetaceae bacterium]|nr:pyrrolo-quinoline quinone [Planctomycetaceae bacterium]MBP62565.1 pyrrolo-quinoline quinone [Planctomycetaceae bacterium]
MRNQVRIALFFLSFACLPGADWIRFRGPDGRGVAAEEEVLLEWNEGTNIAWKAELPGQGISGPIVIGDQVVVTSCSGYRQGRLHVSCFDAETGQKRWERQFWATGRTMAHPKTTTAAATPSSDGQRIFAHFSTNDMVCLDLEGNLLWLRGFLLEYPNASGSLGLASSPIVVGQTLVTQIETDSQSVGLGLDVNTGQTRWAVDRPQKNNWTSPVVLRGGAEHSDLVVMQSSDGLKAYRAMTGEEVWNFSEACKNIPSSTVSGNTIYVPCKGLTALRYEPGSDFPELLWQEEHLGPSTPTPLSYDDKVYSLNGSILKCADANTGQLDWRVRLKGNFTSSPVMAGGHLYCFNEQGVGQVIELGDKGRVVATNTLGEEIMCSPAIANDALYIRSFSHLWKIAQK